MPRGIDTPRIPFRTFSPRAAGALIEHMSTKLAVAISDGAPVGVSVNGGGNVTNFGREPNGMFTTLNINASAPMANGIDNQGSVAGGAGTSAFLLAAARPPSCRRPIPTPNRKSRSVSTSTAPLSGSIRTPQEAPRPALYTPNRSYTVLNPVSSANGVLVVNAQGINNNGMVTGFYSTATTTPVIDANTPQHGFFHNSQTNQFTLLADPNLPNFFLTQLLGIHDNGTVAGYWQNTAADQHGLRYNLASGAYNFFDDPAQGLNDGIAVTQISGIDYANQLSGYCVATDGIQRGFVATPVPAALAITSLGLAGLPLVSRRKA